MRKTLRPSPRSILFLASILLGVWITAPERAYAAGQDAPSAAQDGLENQRQLDVALEAEAALSAAMSADLRRLVGDRADAVAVTIARQAPPPRDWQERVDRVMATVNTYIAGFLFYDVGGSELGEAIDATAALADPSRLAEAVEALMASAEQRGYSLERATITLSLPAHAALGAERVATLSAKKSGVPLAVLWLVLGAIFFTVRMGFVQLRLVGHAVQVTRGKYDNPHDTGEVTHFQALAAALSATVGLGNIAGVAIAVSIGGPGATLWMIIAGFLGMAAKFTECTLGQMYRQRRSDGSVMGGAMYYLSNGLAELGLKRLGKVLAVVFAVLCIGGSFGGGNSFQVNQSLNALVETVPFLADHRWVYGAALTFLTALVIIGGIKRIAQTAERIVPLMCIIYVVACLAVILLNVGHVPRAFSEILAGALTPQAGFGGLVGVLVQGFKRAAFSNEAGVGSAAIAHSAAKTEFPVREGIVSLLEPFIDTIIVCTMTALVIVITGAYHAEVGGEATVYAPYLAGRNGAGLTSQAFRQTISWFPYVLSVAVVLFAFSTMISWSYYGERCWVWLFGDRSSLVYKLLFLVFVFLGSIITAPQLLDFGDLMILGMAFPNVLGVALLSGKVAEALADYRARMARGEIRPLK